tara:strand:- start:5325 stop:6257 length:933 start_codon:yes stop_codon:yes gene_type:complete
MSDIKKRQHYVWRHYLRPWASNERIWTYFKEDDKVIQPGLMGVAQEKHFYKLIDLTEAEENFLGKYIEHTSPETVKGLNLDFLTLFTSHSKLKKQLEANSNLKIDKEIINEEIKKLEHNLMEDAHGKMEALGFDLLKCETLDDLKSLAEDDKVFDAIMFLCFQYFRTKSMKKSALQSFQGDKFEELANKTWNIISYSMATTLARSISLDKNLKFAFVANPNADHFITGDQPVFNILNDKVNDNGEVTELELYYPLSPSTAIRVHFDPEQTEKYIEESVSEETVDYLNKKVIENSDFFVFADSKEILEKYK